MSLVVYNKLNPDSSKQNETDRKEGCSRQKFLPTVLQVLIAEYAFNSKHEPVEDMPALIWVRRRAAGTIVEQTCCELYENMIGFRAAFQLTGKREFEQEEAKLAKYLNSRVATKLLEDHISKLKMRSLNSLQHDGFQDDRILRGVDEIRNSEDVIDKKLVEYSRFKGHDLNLWLEVDETVRLFAKWISPIRAPLTVFLFFARHDSNVKEETFVELIELGVDAKTPDPDGKTVLHYAVERRFVKLAKAAIAAGVDVSARKKPLKNMRRESLFADTALDIVIREEENRKKVFDDQDPGRKTLAELRQILEKAQKERDWCTIS